MAAPLTVRASREGFLDALHAVASALDELSTPSMIFGGVAVIALGVPRLTVDIDASVSASVDLAELARVLASHGIHPRVPDAEAFARDRRAFLAIHDDSGTPVDVSLAW